MKMTTLNNNDASDTENGLNYEFMNISLKSYQNCFELMFNLFILYCGVTSVADYIQYLLRLSKVILLQENKCFFQL